MSGNSAYGPNCEVYLNFDTCIQNAGGSLDPQGWASCTNLRGVDMNKYNECVYNGYKSIVQCFQSFCNTDTTNTVSNMIAARDLYEGLVNSANTNTQTQQQTTPQDATTQTQQQDAAQQAQQQTTGQQTTGQQAGQQNTGNVTPVVNNTKTNSNNGPDANSGATSIKAKLFVTVLAISALAMNFI